MTKRPARAPYVLTLSSRRIARRTLPEVVVPYLRMSGRWLEEHGFAIGSGVQVVIEYGRVTLLSAAAKRDDKAARRYRRTLSFSTAMLPGPVKVFVEEENSFTGS